MQLTPLSALECCGNLLAIGLILQGIEGYSSRGIYAQAGPLGFSNSSIASSNSMLIRNWIWLQSERAVGAVFLLRIALCICLLLPILPAVGWQCSLVLFLLATTSALLVIRTGGPLCGGSDSMFFQTQLGLFIGSFDGMFPGAATAGLAWIAAQSVLSYFLAGWAKARSRGWWTGTALVNLLTSNHPYAVWPPAREISKFTLLCRFLGWTIVCVELLFPCVLALPWNGKLTFISAAFLFHLGVAATLGLNRFLWAWLATYPALLMLPTR